MSKLSSLSYFWHQHKFRLMAAEPVKVIAFNKFK